MLESKYRKFIKIGLDLFSIILGVEGAFLLKYGLEQKKYFNIEYLMAYGIAFVFFINGMIWSVKVGDM